MQPIRLTARRGFVLLGLRILAAICMVAWLAPPCIDAFFRPFHAWYWAQSPQWAPSTVWLPGYTWLYGLAITLTGDTVWTPGVLSAFFFGATLVRLYQTLPAAHRTIALLWIGFTPLSWVVASTGLSEAAFGFFLVYAVTGLARYGDTGDERTLVAAALAIGIASAIRYDAWPLLPVFCVSALRSSRRHGGALRQGIWAILPACVPVAWMGLSWVRRGDPWWFLTSVAHDQYGATDPLTLLTGPGVLSVGLVLVGVGAALAVLRGQKRLTVSVALLGMAVAFAVWVFATGNLPSQLPERMMYPALLLSAPLVGAAWVHWAPYRLLGLATGLLTASAIYLVSLPDAVPPSERQLARLIDEAYAGGQLTPSQHVLVSGSYPEMTALVVNTGYSDRVHLEGVGQRCPHHVLTCDSPCGAPLWREDVAMVLVGNREGQRTMAARGWTSVTRVGPYQVFFRLNGAPALCPLPRVGAEP